MSDRLRFLEQIGVGGMSSVWKAYDNVDKRYVAVKILDKNLSGNDENVQAFLSEEKIMSEIRHPGIVQAYYIDKSESGDTWRLVMEYVDGYTFADLLRRK